jgi:hypothetical protein
MFIVYLLLEYKIHKDRAFLLYFCSLTYLLGQEHNPHILGINYVESMNQ